MCFEGTRRGTPGDALEHRRFDLEITALVEEVAHGGDHLRAGDEHRRAFLVRHQVEVALAILQLAVGDTVPLVGHRAQRLREDGEILDLDGRLADPGGEGFALDADPVAAVEAFEDGELVFGQLLDRDETLDLAVDVADVEEARLTHVAQAGDATRHLDLLLLFEVLTQSGGRVGGLEGRAEGVDPELPKLGELLAADGDQFGFGGLALLLRCVGHGGEWIRASWIEGPPLKFKVFGGRKSFRLGSLAAGARVGSCSICSEERMRISAAWFSP